MPQFSKEKGVGLGWYIYRELNTAPDTVNPGNPPIENAYVCMTVSKFMSMELLHILYVLLYS